MSSPTHLDLSRRERQIMDIVYRRGRATASEVLADLPDPPGYSAVRTMLRRLEEKRHVAHEQDGPRYVYRATVPSDAARETALQRLVRTFFGGSASNTVAALLDLQSGELSDEELERLAELIDQARKGGR